MALFNHSDADFLGQIVTLQFSVLALRKVAVARVAKLWRKLERCLRATQTDSYLTKLTCQTHIAQPARLDRKEQVIPESMPCWRVVFTHFPFRGLSVRAAVHVQSSKETGRVVSYITFRLAVSQVRFGVMLVGPTLGGKTVSYKTLALALTELREQGTNDERCALAFSVCVRASSLPSLGVSRWQLTVCCNMVEIYGACRYQVVQYKTFNPKAISMGELYGEFNPLTQEFCSFTRPTSC
eukprot:2657725-Amphidinium_carterae.2